MGKITITGKVCSGLGRGKYFTSFEWVKRQCEEKLGFAPFPGTLNVRVEGRGRILKYLKGKGIRIVPPSTEFCEATCYPCSLLDVAAAIVFPFACSFVGPSLDEDLIEVIAPLSLREVFSLEDGQEVSITLQDPWRSSRR